MIKMIDMFNMLKIRHYIKNLVIFLPILFIRHLNNFNELQKTSLVFIAFCIVSSVIYIFNDIQDIDNDRAHPIKCHRPIASGIISISMAKKILFAFLMSACCLCSFVKMPCNLCIWGYFLLNICYSLVLKKLKYIDIFCIAIGFVLRILAGFYAISLTVSIPMCLMIFITSLFFTTSKRLLELNLVANTKKYSLSARYTNISVLNCIIYGSSFFSILTYGITAFEYTQYIHYLYISILCFILFIVRLLYLVHKPQNHDDPMNFIENDKIIKLIAIVSLIVLVILYLM